MTTQAVDLAVFDSVSDRCWPSLERATFDGWVARTAAGVTRRANSALPAGQPADLDQTIAAVEQYYTARALPTRFQISPATQPAELDAVLEARGYQVEERALLLVAELDEALSKLPSQDSLPVPVLNDTPSAQWFDLWWQVSVKGTAAQREAAERMLGSAPAVFAQVNAPEPVAIGRGALADSWLGVHCMAVAESERGRGLGLAVLAGLLRWAGDQGATRALLQVSGSNKRAQRLYEGAGFTAVSHYHYRVRHH